MSTEVLSLWDYRQAQYAEAAKWVCGDIGRMMPGMFVKPHTKFKRMPEGALRCAAPRADMMSVQHDAGSFAHHAYRLAFPWRAPWSGGHHG